RPDRAPAAAEALFTPRDGSLSGIAPGQHARQQLTRMHRPRLNQTLSETQQLQRRNRELSILNAIADALNREVELPRALQAALAQVAELLDLHTGWVFLLDDESGKTYLAATFHLPPALAMKPQRMEGTCTCLDSYLEGDMEGAANVNIITCSRLAGFVDGTDG